MASDAGNLPVAPGAMPAATLALVVDALDALAAAAAVATRMIATLSHDLPLTHGKTDVMPQLISHAADLTAPRQFEALADGFVFGGDYSPEQWPEEVWPEDVALMRKVGVNSVNLGIFSWGLLEVADGEFDWGWLDRTMDLLHEGGIGVNLATPTAAPPT
jgi:hypothetical protein